MTLDDATDLVSTALVAGVGIVGMKMVSDMTTNMFGVQKQCPKGKKWCSACSKCMKPHKHKSVDWSDYGFKPRI
tara:strand:+ start:1789 stop:2010 length:222 start_codon:yes stop_codon:yes gene_type:complete